MARQDEAWPDVPYESVYVQALAESLRELSDPLPADVAEPLRAIVTDSSLDGQTAEDKITRLADDFSGSDETLLNLWSDVQRNSPHERRGWGTITPGLDNPDGATHRWRCPVAGCPAPDEPGLRWAPSIRLYCQIHTDVKLERHPLPGHGTGNG
jgi:hypothetical protein